VTGVDFSPDGKLMALALKGDVATASAEQYAIGEHTSDVIAIFNISFKSGKWECLH
jgi:hypothetical protein